MSFDVIDENDQRAKIRVIGVGGGGGNAINNMILHGMEGVDFVAVNTDAQDLERSFASQKFQLGEGLGAGAKPDVGRRAAEEERERLVELVEGYDMVFIAAGMGGGTGTGATPVIAQVAKECGALTVGVVTRPFAFEGAIRRRQAEEGIKNLRQCVDTLITIPNQRLISMATEATTLKESFEQADRVLHQAVKGVSDLINLSGYIGVDFADVCTVMKDKGIALMGIGQAAGEDRVMRAAHIAINSPLLDEVSISGAKHILLNVTSSSSIGVLEVSEAAQMVEEEAHADVNVIFGWVIDENLENEVRVTVIATDFDDSWDDGAVTASTGPGRSGPSKPPAVAMDGARSPRPGTNRGASTPSRGGRTGARPRPEASNTAPRSSDRRPSSGRGYGDDIPPFFGRDD